jgi:hypothetical protein
VYPVFATCRRYKLCYWIARICRLRARARRRSWVWLQPWAMRSSTPPAHGSLACRWHLRFRGAGDSGKSPRNNTWPNVIGKDVAGLGPSQSFLLDGALANLGNSGTFSNKSIVSFLDDSGLSNSGFYCPSVSPSPDRLGPLPSSFRCHLSIQVIDLFFQVPIQRLHWRSAVPLILQKIFCDAVPQPRLAFCWISRQSR